MDRDHARERTIRHPEIVDGGRPAPWLDDIVPGTLVGIAHPREVQRAYRS